MPLVPQAAFNRAAKSRYAFNNEQTSAQEIKIPQRNLPKRKDSEKSRTVLCHARQAPPAFALVLGEKRIFCARREARIINAAYKKSVNITVPDAPSVSVPAVRRLAVGSGG
jgi:hypothetical protein